MRRPPRVLSHVWSIRQPITSILLTTLFIGFLPAPAYAAKTNTAPPPTPRAVTVNDVPPAVERLEGTPAWEHLQRLKTQKPAIFQKAEARLRARGMKPTDQVYGIRSKRRVNNGAESSNGIVLTQQYSHYAQEGEIVFWSWDDGYDGTWEGMVYALNYSTGVSVTLDSQVNIESDGNYWQMWEEVVAIERPEDREVHRVELAPPATDDPVQIASIDPAAARFSKALLATWNRSSATDKGPNAPGDFVLVAAREYFSCAFWWCLGAAIGCAFLGPAAPGCFFAACTAALIACLEHLF